MKPSDAHHSVDALDLGDYVDKKVAVHSRGMRQRLGIAMAVLGNPELLLLDEPMNGLDADGLRALRSMLQTLHREYGSTILLSSHQFAEVEQVANHIAIMNSSGDLLFEGPREELSERVPQELVIKVDCWEDALKLLTSSGYSVEPSRDCLVIKRATPEMAREVNCLLVKNEIGVHHLALDSETLEALFVKVTTTVKAWDAI